MNKCLNNEWMIEFMKWMTANNGEMKEIAFAASDKKTYIVSRYCNQLWFTIFNIYKKCILVVDVSQAIAEFCIEIPCL